MVSRVPSKHRNAPVITERAPGALLRPALLLLCGLVLAGGFVYAGGRQFAALRMGYETEELRQALNQARDEQRRLLLEWEAAASPARLEVAARRLGMQPMHAAQIDPLKQLNQVAPDTKTDAKPVRQSGELKPKPSKQIRTR